MTPDEIKTLRRLMEYEAARTAPPPTFPSLPDLPAGRYNDMRFFELEREHLWRRSWLLAAHTDELPEPGCFMRWENAGQPVVIVHDDDGRIRAFYNTCRHRGAPVVTVDRGKSPRLMCGYHNWTYKTDGTLAGVPERRDFPADFDMSCRGLLPVRCEMFGKVILIQPPLPQCEAAYGNVRWLVSYVCSARASCFRLLLHCMRRAASRAACTAGNRSATSIPMMAITTRSSMRVKPLRALKIRKKPRFRRPREASDASRSPETIGSLVRFIAIGARPRGAVSSCPARPSRPPGPRRPVP